MEVFKQCSQLIQGAVIPAAARASASGGDADVRGVYAWACRWIFALAGLMLAGLWLTAPALLTAWLGPGHDESAAIARSLAVMFACLILAGPATAIARGAGAPGLETATFGIALAVDVALSLVLVPRLGPQGAVLAMTLSIVVAGLWLVPTVHRRWGIATRPWLVATVAPRILIPAAVTAGLAVVGLGGSGDSRGTALRDLVVHGAAFLALAVALTWPTGDARQILHGVVQRLDRRRAAALNVTGPTP
jgi:O-antigen/teichoic acid export membrane protein